MALFSKELSSLRRRKLVAEKVDEFSLGELQGLEFIKKVLLTCFNPLLAGLQMLQSLKDLLRKLRIHVVSAQLLIRIIKVDGGRRMVDGHGAVGGSLRNLHPEETSGGEEFLLPDRGLISKWDVKMLEHLG